MKKTVILILIILIAAISLVAEAEVISPLTGPYLGQDPPERIPEVFAPGIVSVAGHVEMGCGWSPDGKEFYFSRSATPDMASNWAIWVVREIEGNWRRPEIVSFSGTYRDLAPFVTPDGGYLLFFRMATEKAETRQGTWIVDRIGDGWGEPRYFTDAYCLTTADFRTFYMSTEHREDTSRDLARMILEKGTFSSPRDLPGDINSDEFDAHASISADGSYLVFDSSRPGGIDKVDMYVSFKRTDQTWTRAFNLGEDINRGHRHISALSPDGRYLFFASEGDIYWVDAGIIGELKPESMD